jgi:tRNA A-37 threonylcarbamoyl transferase component Bud32
LKNGDFHKQPTIPDLTGHAHPLPNKIGPYKIESLLNQGGMSLLYLASHPETNRPIAIKVLLPKFLKNKEIVARFLKEAQIIAAQDHPNIVKLYGQGKWENGLYIAMEFIRGVSLSQFIQKKSLSLRRSLEIVLQVAYALSHLHGHGVIHRDLKPENILIDEEGDIKVIDFGIAQLQEEEEKKGMWIGTPVYMSPEQRANPSKASYSSDLYSLGLIAYELILGRLSHGAIHLEYLSKPLRAILAKALDKDPRKRYSDIVEFINDISQYLQTIGTSEEERSSEMISLVQKSSEMLIQKKAPNWPLIECGIAWQEGEALNGLYLDFFHLSETRFALLIAEPKEKGAASLLLGAQFRGLARMASSLHGQEPIAYLSVLNRAVLELSEFSIAYLLLDIEKDQLFFLSCQGPSLFVLSEERQEPHTLSTSNPFLGAQANPPFSEVIDNFRPTDLLFLSTTHSPLPRDSMLLSTQTCAERLLETATPPFKTTALGIALRRV